MIRPGSKERALRMSILVAGDFLIAYGALAAIPSKPLDPPLVLLVAFALVAALALSGFYQDRVTPRTRPSIVTAIVIQCALVAIAGAALARPLPRLTLLALPLLEMIALPLWRRILRVIAPVRPRDTILIGHAHDVDEALKGLRLADDQRIRVREASVDLDVLAEPAVQELLRDVEEVILVSPSADARLRLELLRIRGPRGFLMLASHVDALLASRMLGWIGDQPLVEVAVSCGYGFSAVVKRSIDVAGSVILMLVSAPVWIIAACAIAFADGLPILIRQERVGLGGAPYGMWKFRSMRGGAVTRAGSLLRRYHIDELPQLINVWSGDMSLVGPRPERPELVGRILEDVPDFDLRSLVRPGIAGLAQVSSEYDTRPEVKLRYDLMYMCDWSVWLDFRLMLRAVSSSLAGTGQ
ncbi:MAG TPA: sugar transferase [Thermoanaerobaculia bacterium]|nr:sugar transferase [Thermoanaerobaculia bacterium]